MTTHINGLLARLQAGDLAARDELIAAAYERLRAMVRKQLGQELRAFLDSGDVAQTTAIRLRNALTAVHPNDAVHFFRLAAQHIRFEIRDLARRYTAAGRPTPGRLSNLDGLAGTTSDDPGRLAAKAEMAARMADQVHALPDELREAIELSYYYGLSRSEIAALRGLRESEVRRRIEQALQRLADDFPDSGAGKDP